MWKRLSVLCFAVLLATAPATMAQSGPGNDAVPDVILDAPRQQVIQAITGKLFVQHASAPSTALLGLNFSTFSGDIAGAIARTLTTREGNTVVVNQQGSNNTARISQTGQSNVAVMAQYGDLNRSTLTQDGNYNAYGALLQGDSNELDVVQQGDRNLYIINTWGGNLNHDVIQTGGYNTAIQVGPSNRLFGITQDGYGMNITIRHNGAQ